ncbi:alpha/beta hydrolase family protein [Nonomuraea pusilla]|uniref:Alpha/beta hydrolase family protein n=1 Tax=Nonomuraea pusilla TaxID=46177 RepID=A0A1H7TRQ2_9ACTN|nr:lipase [Nonomuraea pusilla]SEL87441.1 Alpha/beta hydrolase family protein [Nonomuraea pusilla]
MGSIWAAILPSVAVMKCALLRRGAAAAVAIGLLLTGPAVQAESKPVTVALPRPTGPSEIGTVALHLRDGSRADPWIKAHARRELMISLWYPTRRPDGHPAAPWLPPRAAEAFYRNSGLSPAAVSLPSTHGREGARVAGRGLPVVLFSPGNGADRSMNTTTVEELASWGYMVVTIDHPGDAGEVEFPDGTVTGHVLKPVPVSRLDEKAEEIKVRVADTRFVLDRLKELNKGQNPDAEGRKLPEGLRGAFDLGRVGMFGHSAGGATAAATMLQDRRVKAVLNLDGPALGKVAAKGLARPYMLMEAEIFDKPIRGQKAFWSRLKGWRLHVKTKGVKHNSYTDLPLVYEQAAPVIGLSKEQLRAANGTLPAARSVAVTRAYAMAFFDLHLRRRGDLLDRRSPRFPEVRMIAR